MNWLAIFLVPFSLDLFEPEIGMTEERVISFSLNNVIALITRVFLSATLSIPIFVIRGRWWTRQWKRISIGRKWSSRPGATHVADCLRSRRRCHGSGSSSSSSSSSRRVTAVSLSVLTETRRIHASTAAPPALLAVIVASADRVVVNRRPAEPGCGTEQLIRVIVVGGNTL